MRSSMHAATFLPLPLHVVYRSTIVQKTAYTDTATVNSMGVYTWVCLHSNFSGWLRGLTENDGYENDGPNDRTRNCKT